MGRLKNLMKIDYTIFRLPMCVIFEHPLDFPNNYVVRIFDINQPTEYYLTKNTLQECREEVKRAGFVTRINRSPLDEPQILETWV